VHFLLGASLTKQNLPQWSPGMSFLAMISLPLNAQSKSQRTKPLSPSFHVRVDSTVVIDKAAMSRKNDKTFTLSKV
jgi:hypothetical protein